MIGRKPVPARGAGGTGAVGAVALCAVGHGLAGVVVAAVTVVLTTAITALAGQLFWLRALSRPGRDQRWLVKHCGSVHDAEHLARQVHRAVCSVLNSRAAQHGGSGDPPHER